METAAPERPAPIDPNKLTAEHEIINKEGKLQIVLANLDEEIGRYALDAAHVKLEEKLKPAEGGNRLTRTVSGIWKNMVYGHVLRDFFLAKYEHDATKAIQENQNLLHHTGESDQGLREGVAMRYVHKFIHHDAGETYKKLDESGQTKDGAPIKNRVAQLIHFYVEGLKMLPEKERLAEFEKAKAELLEELPNSQEWSLYADNLLKIAEHTNAAIEMGEANTVEEVLADAEIVYGRARAGSRVEVPRSLLDKVSHRLAKVPYLDKVLASGIVTGALAATKTATSVLLPGVAVGVLGMADEAQRLRQDRAKMERAEEQGYEFTRKGKVGERLEKMRLDKRSYEDISDGIQALYDGDKLKLDNEDELQEALKLVADCETRVELSDRLGKSLIGWSDRATEEFKLDWLLAKAKTDLAQHLFDQSELGKRSGSHAPTGEVLEDMLTVSMADHKKESLEAIMADSREKDREFMRYALLRSGLMGVAAGATAVGLKSLLHVATGLLAGGAGAEAAAPHIGETLAPAPGGSTSEQVTQHVVHLSNSVDLKAPEGVSGQVVGDHLQVKGTGGVTLLDFALQPDGTLPPGAHEAAAQAGFSVDVHTDPIASPVEHQVSPQEFVANHHDLTQEVTRTWQTGPNEQGLWWGGINNAGLDAHNNIVIDTSHMQGVRPTELLFSVSNDSPPIVVPVAENGQVVIGPDSPLHGLFGLENGTVVNHDVTIEAARNLGAAANGAAHEQILATVAGDRVGGGTTITDTVLQSHTTIDLHQAQSIPVETKADITPIASADSSEALSAFAGPSVPVFARGGLGTMERKASSSVSGGGGTGETTPPPPRPPEAETKPTPPPDAKPEPTPPPPKPEAKAPEEKTEKTPKGDNLYARSERERRPFPFELPKDVDISNFSERAVKLATRVLYMAPDIMNKRGFRVATEEPRRTLQRIRIAEESLMARSPLTLPPEEQAAFLQALQLLDYARNEALHSSSARAPAPEAPQNQPTPAAETTDESKAKPSEPEPAAAETLLPTPPKADEPTRTSAAAPPPKPEETRKPEQPAGNPFTHPERFSMLPPALFQAQVNALGANPPAEFMTGEARRASATALKLAAVFLEEASKGMNPANVQDRAEIARQAARLVGGVMSQAGGLASIYSEAQDALNDMASGLENRNREATTQAFDTLAVQRQTSEFFAGLNQGKMYEPAVYERDDALKIWPRKAILRLAYRIDQKARQQLRDEGIDERSPDYEKSLTRARAKLAHPDKAGQLGEEVQRTLQEVLQFFENEDYKRKRMLAAEEAERVRGRRPPPRPPENR